MSTTMLQLADYLLFGLHIVVIVINLFGWIFRKTRRIQLITILATTFSWIVMGIWYGWGYCFLTDWEWDIKMKLGESDLPYSFVQYLSNNILGMDLTSSFVDSITLIAFLVALVAGITVNYLDYRRNKKSASHLG